MIIVYPDKLLRQKSSPVKPEEISGPEIKKLIADMREWIKKADGVGLAAVQIGALKRVILVEVDGELKVFINPKITRKSWKKTAIEEGCLSVPGKHGYVNRSEKISVKALDESGKEIKLRAAGVPAIIFQHEIDHLEGILFIDKIWKK
ncbi:peptide deformylase [Patescibacteria group bacterium]|nr:peptide deformylase [Patescibacteria group bacterium]